jgi:hypothetical protein
MMRYFSGSGEFIFGKRDFEKSAAAARDCSLFEHDNDEDEEIADEERSCFNCLYRRWTVESFQCTKFKELQ